MPNNLNCCSRYSAGASCNVKFQALTFFKMSSCRLVVFAGDVTPIEIMCHMPAVCEDKDIPYCYIPSKADLGSAMGVHRASVMMLVRPHDDYKELYDECVEEMKHLPHPL